MNKITPELKQMQIISANVKKLLREKGMSQRELSEELGLSESSVGKWLLCRNAPTMGNIQKMAIIFNVQVSDIVNEFTPTQSLQPQEELQATIPLPNYTFDKPQIAFLKAEGAEDLNEKETNELIGYLRLIKSKRQKD